MSTSARSVKQDVVDSHEEVVVSEVGGDKELCGKERLVVMGELL